MISLNAHRKEIVAAEGTGKRERELSKEIQKGDIDNDEGMGGDF
jgi:26S proteasome regulatory subunit N3